jgi:polyphosphate glucokinase
MYQHTVLGIDIGGSGIKGSLIDIRSGEMLGERLRLTTPQPATPEAVADTFAQLVEMHQWKGLVGCGFPAIVKHNVALTAANIDKSWIGVDIADIFERKSGCTVAAVNDADAAGLAMMRFGIGKGELGVVLVVTIGTGIGTALFHNGQLVPNTELGHVFLHNMPAEQYTADSVRKRLELSWQDWGARLSEYLRHLERIMSPDLFILGGGVSKQFDEYASFIKVDTPVRAARLQNNAGAIGAAYYAWQQTQLL